MDTIVTPVTVITLDSTRIVHSIKADLVARYFPPVVRLVQYDQSLPVIAVSLMQNGQTYTLPSGAAANIRVHKPDSTYVYNPALGCDSTRNIVYFEVSQAMASANGDGLAIVEIVVDGDIAGSSLITLHFEDNPVPEDAIESSDEWETIYELGERIIASTVTPVSTAAGMTDHNVVYLYTGTESGWNQGHMYYYNGTTWVDAGIAVTDTTLSVAGQAADAKKVGDEISSLKEDFVDVTAKGYIDASSYVSGARNQNNVIVANNARCTTANSYNMIVGGLIDVKDIPSGYKFVIAGIKNGSYVFDSGWKTADFSYVVESAKDGYYFVNFAKYDGTSNINPTDISATVVKITPSYIQKNGVLIETLESDLNSITDHETTNICPKSTATTVNGGYLNGSTGEFGTITAGKTYTFSATNKSNVGKNLGLRVLVNGSWSNQASIYTTPSARFSGTFTATASGNISLNAFYGADYDPVFEDIQLQEGAIATPYVEYNKLIAVDTVARTEGETINYKVPLYSVLSIAHQGYTGYGAPRNTLQAFKDARTYGFDMVELDIIMTQDRVPVISHDDTRTTVGGVSVTISQTTYADLCTYQFFADPTIKIPTLWEALAICNECGIGVQIEFKGFDFTQEEVTAIVNSSKRSNMRIVYSGWSYGPLLQVRVADENATVQVMAQSMPSINDLKTSATWEKLRSMLAENGRTCFYCDIPANTSDSWFEELLQMGLCFVIGANDSRSTVKTHIKYAFSYVGDLTIRDIMNG